MFRGIDLQTALGEAVAVVGQIDAYRRYFVENGEDGERRLFGSHRALPRAEDILARFHDLSDGANDDVRWDLLRQCQRLVNPVQSNLQGSKDQPQALRDLLSRILSLKSHWAALERYPHAVLHRSSVH